MARPPERLFRLVFEPHDGRALSADSEEKREPARDIETATVESLKVLDTQWPIREADMAFPCFGVSELFRRERGNWPCVALRLSQPA